MRTVIAMIAALTLISACSDPVAAQEVYGAGVARIGESLVVLGRNTSVSNLRWQDDYVLVDVDAAPSDPAKPHADPGDIRFDDARLHGVRGVGADAARGVAEHRACQRLTVHPG